MDGEEEDDNKVDSAVKPVAVETGVQKEHHNKVRHRKLASPHFKVYLDRALKRHSNPYLNIYVWKIIPLDLFDMYLDMPTLWCMYWLWHSRSEYTLRLKNESTLLKFM